ncbi:DUF4129 domain-containing protein [Haloarcula marina]|uniref:DUF4129 domain-containing protein n=1 Tax=Haloarcula marina TaxID=2961574 RepID=UPI0020B6BE30|nr:DUF4129 domain-containing protein [Halomicroarcula marina]
MPSTLVRAALALLCVCAVVFATALFPAALDVGLDQPAPVEASTPRATPTPTPTPTATPTPTPTPVPDASTGGGGGLPDFSWLSTFFALLGLAAVGYVGVLAVRSSEGVDGGVLTSLLARLRLPAIVQRIPQVTTAILLTGSSALATVARGVGSAVRGVGRGLAAGIGPIGRVLGRSLAALPAAAVALIAAPVRSLTGLRGGGFLAPLRGGFDRPAFLRPDDPTTEDARNATDIPPAPDESGATDTGPLSVREAWERLVGAVPVSNPDATTPGEYARRAVDSGLPAGPVWRLTDLFRAVAYGGASETNDRITAARDAIEGIFDRGDDS